MKKILAAIVAVLGLSACLDDGCIDRRCETTLAVGVDPVSGRVVTMPVTTCVCLAYEADR